MSVRVGSLGTVPLADGGYGYVGSARGPGGFARVDRHLRHLRGDSATVHWHVDALTTLDEASFVGAVLAPDVDAECAVARRLQAGPVEGFGASDCGCRSHLAAGPASTLFEEAKSVFEKSASADETAEES